MESLYIVGASGAAKEILLLVQHINATNRSYDFQGFIDLNPSQDSLTIGANSYPVIKERDFLMAKPDTNLVFAIGDPQKLKTISAKYLDESHFSFPNLIHPKSSIDNSVNLGKGNIIAEACILTVDIEIGDFNYINRGVHMGHDVTIESFNVINPCAVISGGVTIKNYNLIGANAAVLQYLKIGNKNKIGAGAVLTASVNDDNVLVGVPAKSIKHA